MARESTKVKIGKEYIGGGAPVLVQSMLNAHATDVQANVQQAERLQNAGCQIIRVSLPTMESVGLVAAIKNKVQVPLVADIHYNYKIALAAVEAGVDKIRLNPGNIGGQQKVYEVAEMCKKHNVPIRIGVNGGSLKKDVLAKYDGVTAEALVESALNHVNMLEKEDFYDIVISLKASHVPTNVKAYRILAERCNYPLHLGVTEAGTYRMGIVKNSIGIGALLLDGIGDTIRVSLTDEPEKEVEAGFDILRAAGFPVEGPEVISCPTCGRTNIPVAQIAKQVEERLKNNKKNIKVAVMGCVVNGIGEGKDADIGIAGGKDSAVLFIKGQQKRVIRGNFVEELVKEIEVL